MNIFKIFRIADMVLDLVDRVKGYDKPRRERRKMIRDIEREERKTKKRKGRRF